MNLDLISAVIFYSIVAVLIYKYRSKFEIMQKMFIVHKTKKGLNFMRRLAKYKTFWKVYSTLAIPTAVFFMILIGKMLWDNLVKIASGVGAAGVSILIPGIKIPGSSIFVPFWPGMIAITVLILVHEFSHGIVAAMEKIKLKATGFGFFAILPLAFVELDEKKMSKSKPLVRMRIAAAGPFANIVVWLILLAFMSFAIMPLYHGVVIDGGLNITTVDKGMPAQLGGLQQGDIIYSVNNNSVLTISDFLSSFKNVHPGDTLTINASSGIHKIHTTSYPGDSSRPYIGVTVKQLSHISESSRQKYGFGVDIFLWVVEVLKWIMELNFLVGIMNFLPIWVLDGSIVAEGLLSYVVKNKKAKMLILNTIFAFYLTLIVLNMVGPVLFPLIL